MGTRRRPAIGAKDKRWFARARFSSTVFIHFPKTFFPQGSSKIQHHSRTRSQCPRFLLAYIFHYNYYRQILWVYIHECTVLYWQITTIARYTTHHLEVQKSLQFPPQIRSDELDFKVLFFPQHMLFDIFISVVKRSNNLHRNVHRLISRESIINGQ